MIGNRPPKNNLIPNSKLLISNAKIPGLSDFPCKLPGEKERKKWPWPIQLPPGGIIPVPDDFKSMWQNTGVVFRKTVPSSLFHANLMRIQPVSLDSMLFNIWDASLVVKQKSNPVPECARLLGSNKADVVYSLPVLLYTTGVHLHV